MKSNVLTRMPREVLREITSKQLLHKWMHYSLQERCAMIEDTWNISLNKSDLRDIYLSQGISFTQPQPVRVAALRQYDYLEK